MEGDQVLRRVEAYCDACGAVRVHAVLVGDPGACACTHCGAKQQLVTPLDP